MLFMCGGSLMLFYVVGDLYVTGSTDCGNKGRLASRFAVLLTQNQNHLILNTQVKRDGDLDMLVLKAQRLVYIVEVELEERR